MSARLPPASQLDAMLFSDILLSKKYTFLHRLGQGCFGAVYKVLNNQKNVHRALKIEVHRKFKNAKQNLIFCNKNSFPYPQNSSLYNQFVILAQLKNSVPGAVKAYSYGQWKHGFFIEMDIYDEDVYHIVHFKNRIQGNQLNQMTISLLKTLRGIHKNGIIHRDLKPQNIMVKRIKEKQTKQITEKQNKQGLKLAKKQQNKNYCEFDKLIKSNKQESCQNEKRQYILIDFGISYSITLKKYEQKARGFIGTPRYASIAAHKNQSQGKKDDIEALLYVIAFSYFKKLPWFRIPVDQKQKLGAIMRRKMQKSIDLFKSLGSQYLRAYEYIRQLKKGAEPNYEYLIHLFQRSQILTMNREIQQPSRTNQTEKRLSIPTRNSLLIPTLQTIDDEGNSKNNSQSYLNLSAFSQKVQSELVTMIFKQYQLKQFEENIDQGEIDEPLREDISKYSHVILLQEKNPFNSDPRPRIVTMQQNDQPPFSIFINSKLSVTMPLTCCKKQQSQLSEQSRVLKTKGLQQNKASGLAEIKQGNYDINYNNA